MKVIFFVFIENGHFLKISARFSPCLILPEAVNLFEWHFPSRCQGGEAMFANQAWRAPHSPVPTARAPPGPL